MKAEKLDGTPAREETAVRVTEVVSEDGIWGVCFGQPPAKDDILELLLVEADEDDRRSSRMEDSR